MAVRRAAPRRATLGRRLPHSGCRRAHAGRRARPFDVRTGRGWCRNILAAGRCTLTFEGKEAALTAPEVVVPGVAEPQLPAETLREWRGQGIAHYLSLMYAPRVAGEAAPAPPPPMIQLHETTNQRLAELKSSREAVVRQNSANRRIADHLKQAQRIARVGSWEWERKANRVVCSEEVFRLLHVDAENFQPTTASLLRARPRRRSARVQALDHPDLARRRAAGHRPAHACARRNARSPARAGRGVPASRRADGRRDGHDPGRDRAHARDPADPPARLLRRADRAAEPLALPREARRNARRWRGARQVVRDHVPRPRPVQAHQRHARATPSATICCASSRSG